MIISGTSKARLYKLPNLERKETRDLNARIPGAENFTYGEFTKSQTASRLGIENIPSKDEWESIELLAVRVLQPLRKKFGPLKITSGFRSSKLNDAIGGSSTSYHCSGNAVDFEPVIHNISLTAVIRYIHENLDYSELIAEYFPDGWVHVAYDTDKITKIIKLKDKTHNYQHVTMEYIERIYVS